MRIVKIEPYDNGAHANQTWQNGTPPDGYAIIPATLATPNFPFGEIEVESIDGVMTVTSWVAGVIPEPEPEPEPEPSTEEILLEIAADHEARLCEIELGV
jgi:hypothetical protein